MSVAALFRFIRKPGDDMHRLRNVIRSRRELRLVALLDVLRNDREDTSLLDLRNGHNAPGRLDTNRDKVVGNDLRGTDMHHRNPRHELHRARQYGRELLHRLRCGYPHFLIIEARAAHITHTVLSL